MQGSKLKELLRELVQIPSPTGQEGAVQDFLEAYLKKLGFATSRQEIASSRPNLIAWRGRNPLLLCTHVDTLPASSYELVEDGPFLRGRGVIDAKGQIAALLVALEMTTAPATLSFTVDEEDKGLGSKALKLPEWVSWAVVLEPTELKVAIAQAGAVEVEITVRGREAHGACPSEGDNAIFRAVELLQALKEMPSLKEGHPLIPPPFVTPYWIKGGDPELFLVPGEAVVRIDIKIPPPLTIEQVLRDVEKAVEPFGSVKVLDADPPFETPPDAEVVRLVREAYRASLGEEPELVGMPSWTDAEPLHQKGIEVVVLGAGALHQAHTAEEKVQAEELIKLAELLKALLERAQQR